MRRSDIEIQLNQTWYGDNPPSLLLRMLTPLYQAASGIDRWWKLRRRCEDLVNRPIIVVGNLTAGGSGKTPLVIRLCQVLKGAGLKPAVASRGYGRTDRQMRLVTEQSDPSQVGDEPLLIARRTGVPVAVASDRCEASRMLFSRGADVVICDDGLQHHGLPRDMEICVVDGSRGFGNGRLIPSGPLREPVTRLESVDHVVINGEPGDLELEQPVQYMQFITGMLNSLGERMGWRLSQFRGCKVNAVAGVGNPSRFFDLLRRSGISVIEHPFPDHHAFRAEDFEPMNPDYPILMTEKDAMKCLELGLKNAWYLTVDAVLSSEWESTVVEHVRRRIREYSGNGDT